MAGVDIESVARRAQLRWQVPVVPVDCGGFYGNKNFGQRIAGDALFRHVIGTREPDPVDARMGAAVGRVHDVNLIGEWNVGGEFWNVARSSTSLGCACSAFSRAIHDSATCRRCTAPKRTCSSAPRPCRAWRGISRASTAHPFRGELLRCTGHFPGVAGLRIASERLGPRGANGEDHLEREEASVQIALASVRPRLQGKRALIFSGGFKSWSTVSALQYLGVEVVATGIEKSTDEDVVRIRELLGPNARLIDNNDQETIPARRGGVARRRPSRR